MDGFRGAAILGIAMFHLIGVAGVLTSRDAQVLVWGWLPHLIDALFLISGFVLFLPTVASGGRFGTVKAFAIRRAARLLPAYWLTIGVILLLIAIWPSGLVPATPSFSDVLIHLSLLQMPAEMVDPDFVTGLSIDGPLWTLSVEAMFYVLLPLVAGFYYKRPLLGLAIAALITIGWKEAITHSRGIADALGLDPTPERLTSLRVAADDQLPAWTFSFALGMTSAWIFVELRRRFGAEALRRWAPVGQVVSLLLLALFGYLLGRYVLDYAGGPELPNVVARREPLITLGFTTALGGVMLATILAPPRAQAPFIWGPSRALGDISYGVYMIHLPFLLFTAALLPGVLEALGSFWALLLIAIPASIAYGYLSARFLERPIRRWAHRRRMRIERRAESDPG